MTNDMVRRKLVLVIVNTLLDVEVELLKDLSKLPKYDNYRMKVEGKIEVLTCVKNMVERL